MAIPTDAVPLPGSFRDPSGFVFEQGGRLYRRVNAVYREQYDLLVQSGLLEALHTQRLLVRHRELDAGAEPDAGLVLEPEIVPFISYPYEWSVGQLKDAALLTLRIQKLALDHEMTLKDASAYNIQFVASAPIHIDTLSFERYQQGEPWAAYRQFCEHFVAPLVLMSYCDLRLGRLLGIHLDGIPLGLVCRILGRRGWRNPGVWLHVRAHARAQSWGQRRPASPTTGRQVSKAGLYGLVDSLRATIESLRGPDRSSAWGRYVEDAHHYSEAALASKRQIVTDLVRRARPSSVWDLGANTGEYSRIAADLGCQVISIDSDPVAVERNYQLCKARKSTTLPLLADLTNPSPGIGWLNAERPALLSRGKPVLAMALALLHHLAIGNNLSFRQIAEFLAGLAEWSIVEFVPKADPMVQLMLSTRRDIFAQYDLPSFEREFARLFEPVEQRQVADTERSLYLYKRRG